MAKSKNKLFKKISHLIEYTFVLVVSFIISLFPFSFMDSLAAFLVRLLVPVLPKAEKRIKENLEKVYYPWLKKNDPDFIPWTTKKEKDFIRENLRHSLRVSLEIFHSRKFKNKKFIDKYIYVEEESTIRYFQEQTTGMVGVEGHLGNWELGIPFYFRHGVPISFIAKHLSNPYVDKMLEKRRTTYGGKNIFMEESAELIKHLKNKEVIGLVSDQDAGKSGIMVDFFDMKASTFPGPALLTYLSGSQLMLFTCIFTEKGRYKVDLIPVIEAGNHKKNYSSRSDAIQKITEKWVKALEKESSKYPEQYFWIHRRWKHSPDWNRTI